MQGYVIALDQGTTSSRAIIFDREGNIFSQAQYPFEQHYPKPGWVEHDPMDIVSTQFHALGAAFEKSGLSAADIAACLFRGGSALRLDMRVLALAFAVCWAGISFLYRGAGRAAPRRLRQMTVERRGRRVSLRALEDTGNGLVDPITGLAAFVAEAEAVRGLFSPADAAYLRAPPTEAALHIPGARLIPYAGVEGKSGLLLAFRPDKVTVDGRERRDLIAAVSPGRLGPDGSYDAVL